MNDMILDHARSIDFTENVAIKGRGIGANAFFLLPSIAVDTILCIGKPSENDLEALQSFASNVIIHHADTANTIESLEVESVDYVYVVNTRLANKDTILRVLKPDGCIYYEYYGEDHTELASIGYDLGLFWVTPNMGPMQTAVPFVYQNSKAFIRTKKLYTSSVRHQIFDPLRLRLFSKKPTKPQKSIPQALPNTQVSPATPEPINRTNKGYKRNIKKVLRRTREVIINRASAIEQFFVHSNLGEDRFMRCGRLVSRAECEDTAPIPAYIQNIAVEKGINLSDWNWLYLAKGDYGSQKLLFFLFPEGQKQPTILVKMVRNSQYNGRLEREEQGLTFLHQSDFTHKSTIPRILFSGYHGNLKIVAESVHDGRPFDKMSSLDENCPYAHDVVDWLISLAQSTRMTISGAELVDLLNPLYEQFINIYQPYEEQKTFLKNQLERLKDSPEIPLVFRHGDPGIHNFLITDEDTVAFLDWENAEQHSMPLWDLFYFFSSYCFTVGQVKDDLTKLEAYRQYFFNETRLFDFVRTSIKNYADEVGVDSDLLVPLYYLFWMYQALKQATIIHPDKLHQGYNWRVLQLSLSQLDSPMIQALSNHTT